MSQAPKIVSFAIFAITFLFPVASYSQSKFLFSNEIIPLSSCTLPSVETYIVITGMRDDDTYISRKGPSNDFDYTYHFYPFESYIQPSKPFLSTVDTEAAELCDKIENGDLSKATLEQFRAKVDADAYWWEVTPPSGNYWTEYSPRTNDYPSGSGLFDSVDYTQNGYVSARMTTLATPTEFAVAQKRIYGTGKAVYITRGTIATVFTLEGVDTDHAFYRAKITPRDVWRGCALNSGRIYSGGEGEGEENTLINGVSSGCNWEDRDSLVRELELELSGWANCLEGIVYNGEYGETVEYDGEGRSTGTATDIARLYREEDTADMWAYVVSEFEFLCPANNQRLAALGCEAGNQSACYSVKPVK